MPGLVLGVLSFDSLGPLGGRGKVSLLSLVGKVRRRPARSPPRVTRPRVCTGCGLTRHCGPCFQLQPRGRGFWAWAWRVGVGGCRTDSKGDTLFSGHGDGGLVGCKTHHGHQGAPNRCQRAGGRASGGTAPPGLGQCPVKGHGLGDTLCGRGWGGARVGTGGHGKVPARAPPLPSPPSLPSCCWVGGAMKEGHVLALPLPVCPVFSLCGLGLGVLASQGVWARVAPTRGTERQAGLWLWLFLRQTTRSDSPGGLPSP